VFHVPRGGGELGFNEVFQEVCVIFIFYFETAGNIIAGNSTESLSMNRLVLFFIKTAELYPFYVCLN
jgi:hypothetical protein